MEKSNILIVDDEKKIRSLLKEHLSTEFEVITANDGIEAWSVLQKQNIDIVLLDIKMPGMDGMTLLRKIYKKIGEHTNKIIIILYLLHYLYKYRQFI